MLKKIALVAGSVFMMMNTLVAQVTTNRAILEKTAQDFHRIQEAVYRKTISLAKEKNWPLTFRSREGNRAILVGVDQYGLPIYLASENNIAANTTGTSQLWNGGLSGLNLSGSSDFVKGKMAIWDAGRVLSTHVELNGRILQKDNPVRYEDHATHVAGTLIAAGVNPVARGMAYGLQQLIAYDYDGLHFTEISNEAPNLLLSNHSYGIPAGWSYNNDQSRWEFLGRYNENEDYKFGYYDFNAQLLDSIAYNAPYYLMVKSSGNSRNENGPAVGQPYWRYNSTGSMTSAGNRPSGISNNDGYDGISTYGTSKNILTVGAVRGIENGYYKPADVAMSSFSSWGPTDDGRIKPDLVADGVNLLSCVASGETDYASLSGTSMSAPNTTGSLLLLQEYYARLHNGSFMRAATLKGLAIHTAGEAGDAPGPDYKYGWGLLNVAKAAAVIDDQNNGSHRIYENVLQNSAMDSITFIASGKGPLVATLSWTDPKGPVASSNTLNNPELKLVNDLDLRIKHTDTLYKPWILDPAVPFYPATYGDNFRDNVEKVEIEKPVPGKSYTIVVSHKNSLQRGSQAYSLIVSGVGGTAYCSSGATNTSGARVDSLAFAGIKKAAAGSCTTYTDFTGIAATVEPNQQLPLTVAVGSCDNSSTGKIVKAFIDFNNNGSFEDEGDLVATSPVINGAGVFTTTVKIPGNITPGNISRLRIVVQDASDAAAVQSCGNFANGETQDYVVRFVNATNDISLIGMDENSIPTCPSAEQYLTIKVRNNGSQSRSDIPVSVLVQNGPNTVASLFTTIPATIGPYEVFNYTAPLSFEAMGGETYTVKSFVNDGADQVRTNDTLVSTFTVAQAPEGPQASASVCMTNANLAVKNPSFTNTYFWYASPADTAKPIGVGAYINTQKIPDDKKYYVSSGWRGSLGVTSKTLYANGGGYLSNNANYIKYNSTQPLILESARLYSKYGGKVNISVIQIVSESSESYSYRTMNTTTVDVYTTSPTPVPGAVNGYDAADTGAVFRINLPLPAGNYAILVEIPGQANLFRNSNLVGNPYPFDVPGLISFYSNSAASSSTDPNFFQSYYYYLYDMKLRTAECLSSRSSVSAYVSPAPVITVSNDLLLSSSNTGNQWNLNGNIIAGATSSSYKPTASGNYSVTVRDSLNCVQTSAVVNFSITAVDPVANAAVDLHISPNPGSGIFTVNMNLPRRDDVQINIYNSQGQQVFVKEFRSVQGAFAGTIDLRNQGAGIYMMRIRHGKQAYYNKLLIQR